MNWFKILAFREPFYGTFSSSNMLWKIFLAVENFLDCGKFSWSNCLWKIFLTMEKIIGQLFSEKLSWSIFLCILYFPWSNFLCKITLIVENLFDLVKLPWLWKFFLIKENYLNYGKTPWSRKITLTVEIILGQIKLL